MKKQTNKKEEPAPAPVEAKQLPTLEELHHAEDMKVIQKNKLQRKILKILEKEGKFKAQLYYETIKKQKTVKVADTEHLTRQEILSAVKDVITSH